MLAPALGYVILLVGVPFVFAIVLGFSNATAGSLSFEWSASATMWRFLGDPIFLRALRNSVVVTVGSQVLVVILATAAAQVFRATFHGKRFARFELLLPWAVPVSLAAIAWTWIFDSTFSVINWTLRPRACCTTAGCTAGRSGARAPRHHHRAGVADLSVQRP